MKSTAWTVILLALTFAIGWTSRVVVERGGETAGVISPADEAPAGTGRGPDRTGGDHRRGGRHGGFGRFLESVREFSEELALTPEQEASLQSLFDTTLHQIHAHEEGIRDVTEAARPQLREILTEVQRARLDELVEARYQLRSEQKVRASVDRARTEFGLDEERLVRLEAVLRTYEDGKRQLFSFREGGEGGSESDSARERMRAGMGDLRAELESKLGEFLDAEQLERLLQRSSGGRRFGKDRDLVE